MPKLMVVLLAACLAAGGCASEPASRAPAASGAAGAPRSVLPGEAAAYAALARGEVTAYAAPGGRALATFPAEQAAGSPTPFLVQAARRDAAGRPWVRVQLPRRPNGSSGWVEGGDVRLRPLEHEVEVDISERRLRVLRGGREVASYRVGVGRADTPTPAGRFFVTVKLRPPAISRVYGAWALGLAGWSEVLEQWGTGDGQIALHGTNHPAADLGEAVSNGCIRLHNDAITRLAEELPLGTPVTVRK